MSARKETITPLPPTFRGRAFADAGGTRRFGVTLAINGCRFAGSVLLGKDNRADVGAVANLLESLAASVRRAR